MAIFNQKRTEYHLITCNHPFMMDAGMSSFTIPQLIDWWNFRSGGGYVNRRFFPRYDFGLGDLLDPLYKPRGEDVYIRPFGSYSFNAWRFENYNAGVYKNYSVLSSEELKVIEEETNLQNQENEKPLLTLEQLPEEWAYYNKNPDATIQDSDPYSWNNLDIESYTGKTFDRPSKTLIDFPQLKREQDLTDSFYANYIFQGILPANLVAMNDYYNIVGFGDNAKDIATKKFLYDIKRSKNAGYISWSGIVPLSLIGSYNQNCLSDETFVYKLYLFDKSKPLDHSKSQVFPSITLATYAVGPDGTNQKDKVDGESFAITDDSPGRKIGGQLKTSYRSYDGTFAAGSEQIYGIVVSDRIPAVDFPEDMVDWAENMDIEQHFKDPVTNKHLSPGSGLVIPIDMQNANPFQWAPNYANPKGCRGDNKDKVNINVFNMSTREFKKGETVLLTDRYSLWFIDPIASGAAPAEPLKKTVSKWQFTYHITNQDFFYRFADPTEEGNTFDDWGQHLNPKVVNCMEAEEALSRKYLAARNETFYKSTYGELATGEDSDFREEKDAGKAWPGYAQVTSWDFMGTHLAGLRQNNFGGNLGNALVLTTTSKNHRGEFLQEFNTDGILGVGRFTAPFFGCAFPDGYLGGDETNKYADLNAAVKEGDNFTGNGFYVSGQDILQNEAFFNQDSYGNKKIDNTGVLDPTNLENNISTNISPLYFFKNLYDEQEVADEPHCNIFSSKEKLYHLPADMGVNGSFNAEYGGPILSLHKVQKYITTPLPTRWSNPTVVYDRFHDFWLDSGSFQWLYNIVDSETKQETFNTDNSTFDIRPLNPNRVEFRPLRDSVFAQFDPPQVEIVGEAASSGNGYRDSRSGILTIPYPAKRMVEQGFNNYPDIADGTIGESYINSSQYGGNVPLWSRITKQRLIQEAGQQGGLILYQSAQAAEVSDSMPDAVKDVQRNSAIGDIGLSYSSEENDIMPFKYNPWYLADDKLHLEWDKLNLGAWYQILENLYPNYVPDNHYGARPNSLSRGGYGVIGAMCTSEMEAGVQIKTTNVIGQRHKPISNVFYPSWGARQDLLYNDPNTTALFVKIYEAWPRDQTIFDARFFAVHHFNDGNKLQKAEDDKRPWEIGYEIGPSVNYGEKDGDGNLIREDENPFYEFTYSSGTQQVSEIVVEPYFYNGQDFTTTPTSGIPIIHDRIVTNVDHKVPSIFSKGNVNIEITDPDLLGVTEEDLIPSRDSFVIEPLLDSEGIDANNLLAKSSLIFKEGVVVEAKTSNYVIDGDVVKNLDRYLEEKFGEDEDFKLSTYRSKYEKYIPLVHTSLWNVDPNRRARLLPWIYKKHDMGLGVTTLVEDPDFVGPLPPGATRPLVPRILDPGFIDLTAAAVDPEDTLHDIVKSQEGKNIIVADAGAGYSIGNIFTVTGGTGSNVQMRVSAVNDDGAIEGLEWILEEETVVGNEVSRPLCGYGFLPSDFLAGETTNITTETKSNLRITPVGNINTSFKAYFVAGYTSYEQFIDRKPQVVTDIKDAYRVSAPNNKNGESGKVSWRDNQDVEIIPLGAQPLVLGDGTAFVATPGGLENTDHVVGDNVTSLNLSYDAEKSNPNVLKGAFPKYDLFFHFHGDISHQWMATQDTPVAFENLVDMELFPF